MANPSSTRETTRGTTGWRRRTARGLVLGALAAPLLVVGVSQAQAAELAPIADEVDSAVAGTDQTVVDTVAAALGVETD